MSKKKASAGSSTDGKKTAKPAATSKARSTAVKAKPATKTERAKAGAAANPVEPKAVENPPRPPAAAQAQSANRNQPAGVSNQPAWRVQLPFKRPAAFNFAGVGRNDICPCGSGKRFKNCHGR